MEHHQNPQHRPCPKCGKPWPVFDGWECHPERAGCGYQIPDKARKAHPKVVEMKPELRKQLGLDEPDPAPKPRDGESAIHVDDAHFRRF